jgi:hypothetical protein
VGVPRRPLHPADTRLRSTILKEAVVGDGRTVIAEQVTTGVEDEEGRSVRRPRRGRRARPGVKSPVPTGLASGAFDPCDDDPFGFNPASRRLLFGGAVSRKRRAGQRGAIHGFHREPRVGHMRSFERDCGMSYRLNLGVRRSSVGGPRRQRSASADGLLSQSVTAGAGSVRSGTRITQPSLTRVAKNPVLPGTVVVWPLGSHSNPRSSPEYGSAPLKLSKVHSTTERPDADAGASHKTG